MRLYQTNILKEFSSITHAFTTKDGGVSNEPYSSLNLAFHVGDEKSDVIKNHSLLAKELNYNVNSLVHMKQIHSNLVHIVDEKDDFSNPPMCDALITDKKETPLMVMSADCAPILFYDDVKKVIAVAHAGRQGTFHNIVSNVIESFQRNYQSNSKDIYAAIGASIGVCCYEVGEEINKEALKRGYHYAMTQRDDSFYLDVTSILKVQLLTSGMLEENIEISQECSCCKNDRYFSYRADGITGRFAGVLVLN